MALKKLKRVGKTSVNRANKFIGGVIELAETTGVNADEYKAVLGMLLSRIFVEEEYNILDFMEYSGEIYAAAAKQIGKDHLATFLTTEEEIETESLKE